MKTLACLIEEVGQWSVANFGATATEHLGVYVGPMETNIKAELGSMASLLGIVEEVGELAEAINDDNDHNLRDAIGDIMIYLCDYMYREGMAPTPGSKTELPMAPLTGLVASIGRLCHVTLKRHQGIRGYDDDVKYKIQRDSAVLKILGYLQVLCYEDHEDPLYLANVTWETVVSKRNWKKDSEDGGGHNHKVADPQEYDGEPDRTKP